MWSLEDSLKREIRTLNQRLISFSIAAQLFENVVEEDEPGLNWNKQVEPQQPTLTRAVDQRILDPVITLWKFSHDAVDYYETSSLPPETVSRSVLPRISEEAAACDDASFNISRKSFHPPVPTTLFPTVMQIVDWNLMKREVPLWKRGISCSW